MLYFLACRLMVPFCARTRRVMMEERRKRVQESGFIAERGGPRDSGSTSEYALANSRVIDDEEISWV